MNVTVIIPNYNGSNLIKKNLPVVINVLKNYRGSSIIVVDDGSEKEDRDILGKFVEEKNRSSPVPILYIKHEINLGFSSAVNTGVKKATSDLVIFLNSDVLPKENFLDPVLKRFEKDPRLFGVGFLDESVEGENVIKRGRGCAKWERGMLTHSRGEINTDKTFWVSGGSSAYKRDIYEKLGGMDIIYNPFYWEDIDLSYRAQKAGYNIAFERESVVEHKHEEGAIKSYFKKDKITTIAYRNQFIFIWKNITDTKLVLQHIIWLPYHIIRALIRFDRAFMLGLLFATLKLADIIEKRNRQMKYYEKTDQEIINYQ